jgi:hypothetical protein
VQVEAVARGLLFRMLTSAAGDPPGDDHIDRAARRYRSVMSGLGL